jgi:uncharacterized NAD(P)/FAD-binding protein YdhS
MRLETNWRWQSLSLAEQRRFLRHFRPFWDTHHHRMAPQIGTVVHDSLRDGSLEVLAGPARGFRLLEDGVEMSIAISTSEAPSYRRAVDAAFGIAPGIYRHARDPRAGPGPGSEVVG